VRKYYSPLGARKLFFVGVMDRKAEDKNYTVPKLDHSLQPFEWT
jgi:hypothetical protein